MANLTGIKINDGFSVGAPVALDKRQVLTFEQMVAMNDNVMPEVYSAVSKDDGCIYLYNKENEADPVTGKFRKLEFDGEDKITDNITANCEVGGIVNGTEFAASTPVTAILTQLLTKYYPPQVTLVVDTDAVVKKGTSLENVLMTAEVTKTSEDIVNVTFDAGTESNTVDEVVTDGGEFSYTTTTPITEDVTFTVTVTDGRETVTDSATVTFVDPIYYGLSDIADVTSTDDLSEIVELPGSKTVTYTSDNQYIVYATTQKVTSIKDVNGFENIGSFDEKTTEFSGVTYYVYISKTPVTTTDYKYTFSV